MSIVRMLKTVAAAVLAAAATAVSAAEVISVNFTQNGLGTLDGATVYANLADSNIPGAAWNTFAGASSGGVSGTYTLTQYWDGTQAKSDGTAVVTYEARNMWNATREQPYMNGYLDDGEHNGVYGPTVSVTGIPYDVYDVILYANTDTANGRFRAFTVNGFSYSYVDGAVVKGRSDDWGTAQAALEEGKNAFRITGLTGNLSIQGGSNRNGARGCLAAVQIVRNTTAVVVPAMNFKYLSGSGNVIETTSANWYSAVAYATQWHWDHAVVRERIAYSRNAYSVNDNYKPGTDVQWPNMTAFTMAYIFDVTDMEVAEGKRGVMASMGAAPSGNSIQLYKGPDGSVSITGRAGGSDLADCTATIPASEISQGYHLFIVTCDYGTQTAALRMDGGAVRSISYGYQPTVGFQIGKTWDPGQTDPWAFGTGLGVYAVFGWEKVLTDQEITLLYNDYADALGTPVNYNFTSDFNNGNNAGVLYVPTMTGGNALQGTRGTIEIPTNSVVSVPSICLGNSGTAYNYTFNVKGTLNVTAASTTYNVYSEKGNKLGILFGHWAGTGVENITGTLNAPDAWLETTYTHTSETLNIDGGKVTVRGIYAPNTSGNSSATLSNGGTLEVGELRLDKAWPLTCGEGTIRALAYDGATGITHNRVVTFTDTAVGTTLDPNGLAINFTGTAGGAGKVIIEDSSAVGNGTVSFTSMSGLTGTVEVRTGTLEIGDSRPSGEFTFANGTKLVLKESVADGGNRVALAIAGSSADPTVEMYRADGATPVSATVETDAQTGLKYIAYETTSSPVVDGEACWVAYEFENRSLASIGRDKTMLTYDGNGIRMQYEGHSTDNDYKDDHSLYAAARSWRDITYPNTWAAAVYATIPQIENAALMTFGTRSVGLIGLVAGDTTKNEVLLVRTTGDSQYTKLATMTVPNAYSTPHLYVFSKTARKIEVYLDGTLWTTYTADADITFGNGFQIGSVHGGVGSTGVLNFSANADGTSPLYYLGDIVQNSYIGMLRLYDSTLSAEAAEALADEFPYTSPNGTYTRAVASDGTWESADAWASGGQMFDVPVENAVVEITAEAVSTLTVGTAVNPVTNRLESLKIDGGAAFTLATATGSELVNTGRTVINTDVTVTLGVSVSGGPLALASGKTLTFDYTSYVLPRDAPNGGTIQLTGVCSGDENIAFIPPSDTKGRTFTLAFDAATQCWDVRYARGAYTLRYVGPAEGDWSALDVWVVDGSSTPAAFLQGDSVVFGATANEAVTVSIPAAVNVGGITFESQNATAYTLVGTINVDGAPLTVAGNAAIADLRGTLGAVSLTGGEVSLGTGGTLTLPASVAVSAGTKLTVEGGNGTIEYAATDNAFNGGLEVKQGTFWVNHREFTGVIATEANPVKVNGTGTFKVTRSANNNGRRLPDYAFVEVEGSGAKFEVEGNNPFQPYENRDKSVTVICRDGGTFQVNSKDGGYNVHVKAVELDSGRIILAGTVNSWSNRSLEIDTVLTVKGDSFVGYENNINGPDYIYLREAIDVQEGATLTLSVKTTGTDMLRKTGAGSLALGDRFYVQGGTVNVNAGTLVANAALQAHATTVNMAAGTTLKVPEEITLPFTIPDGQTWTLGGRVTVDIGTAAFKTGDKIIGWTAGNTPAGGKFVVRTAGAGTYSLLVRDDGAYITSGFMLRLR